MLQFIISLTIIFLASIPLRLFLFNERSTVKPAAQIILSMATVTILIFMAGALVGDNIRFPQI